MPSSRVHSLFVIAAVVCAWIFVCHAQVENPCSTFDSTSDVDITQQMAPPSGNPFRSTAVWVAGPVKPFTCSYQQSGDPFTSMTGSLDMTMSGSLIFSALSPFPQISEILNSFSTTKTNLDVGLRSDFVVVVKEAGPDVSGTISLNYFLSSSSSAALFLPPASLGGFQRGLLSGIPRLPNMNSGPPDQNSNLNTDFSFSTSSSSSDEKHDEINRLVSKKLNALIEKAVNPSRSLHTAHVNDLSNPILGPTIFSISSSIDLQYMFSSPIQGLFGPDINPFGRANAVSLTQILGASILKIVEISSNSWTGEEDEVQSFDLTAATSSCYLLPYSFQSANIEYSGNFFSSNLTGQPSGFQSVLSTYRCTSSVLIRVAVEVSVFSTPSSNPVTGNFSQVPFTGQYTSSMTSPKFGIKVSGWDINPSNYLALNVLVLASQLSVNLTSGQMVPGSNPSVSSPSGNSMKFFNNAGSFAWGDSVQVQTVGSPSISEAAIAMTNFAPCSNTFPACSSILGGSLRLLYFTIKTPGVTSFLWDPSVSAPPPSDPQPIPPPTSPSSSSGVNVLAIVLGVTIPVVVISAILIYVLVIRPRQQRRSATTSLSVNNDNSAVMPYSRYV